MASELGRRDAFVNPEKLGFLNPEKLKYFKSVGFYEATDASRVVENETQRSTLGKVLAKRLSSETFESCCYGGLFGSTHAA